MKTRNFFGLAAVLLLLVSVSYGQSAGTPKFVIKSTEFSVGEVKKGAPAAHSYTFKNEGTVDLEIKRVAPACGCTASDFTKIVPPGKEGKITLSVSTENYTGPVTKTAEVYTNDPEKEQVSLSISFIVLSDMTPKGKMVGPFIVGPNDHWSARVPRGMSLNGLVAVSNNTAQPIKVTKMIPGGEAFKVEMQTLEEGKRYSLSFVSMSNLPLGSNKQVVKLLTDSKEMPELPIELEVLVYPAVSVTPTSLVFENVAVSEADSDVTYLSKFLWVTIGRGDGLQVTSMTSDLPFVKIKVESTDVGGRSVILRIGFNAKPPVGTHNGKIRVETNNSDVKFVEVPITVTAK